MKSNRSIESKLDDDIQWQIVLFQEGSAYFNILNVREIFRPTVSEG
ncbi:MAG: hypothetical protein GJ680_01325 [Alteromonadaceae bacterium]|nr:hypothetical protein [Alteromonadaceae bacterium]